MGPGEVAGYYSSLAAGFEQLGVDCAMLMVVPHRFRYAVKAPRSRVAQLALAAARRTYRGWHTRPVRPFIAPINWISRAVVLAHAVRSYDVFIFSCGDTLLHPVELKLLKGLGKKLLFVFHGSDSRPPYINGKYVILAGEDPGRRLARQARRMKRRLRWVHRYADAIIDSPLSGHFHDRRFVNWFRIGIPYTCAERSEAESTSGSSPSGGPLRVVHAPSDSATKGSSIIAGAIERARARGLQIDFVQIKERPNSEVIAELARCDFVIDELYSDVPGAALAFEAAALGKPTIVGGYGMEEFRRWIPADMVLPTHYCRPDELDDAIDRLARDGAYRIALGNRARQFVRDKCAPAAVAERILRVLDGRDVDDWWVEPGQIEYLLGTGLPAETARSAVRAVIDAATEEGLQLSGNRALVDRLRGFAYGHPVCP